MAAHNHWRIKVTTNNGANWCAIGEIEFRETLGGADAATGGTATSTDVYTTDYSPDKAFNDDGGTTFWLSTEGPDWWIAYEFTAAVDIVQITLTAPSSSSYMEEMPQNFHVQWSDDGVNWTTVSSMLGESAWTVDEVRTYDLASYPASDATVTLTAVGAQVLDAGGTPAARLSGIGAQVLVLDPDYVPIPGKVVLAWEETNTTDTAHNVYHDTATMDPQALPAPLASGLDPALHKYEHVGTFERGVTHYYRVGVSDGTVEKISNEATVEAVGHVNAQIDVVLVVADDTHDSATNTKQALIDAGFDADRIAVVEETATIPTGDIILVHRGVDTQAEADKVITHWANGVPVVWGPTWGFFGGETGASAGSTFANLTGTVEAAAATTGQDGVDITDATHWITSPFGAGQLVLHTGDNFSSALDDGAAFVGTKLGDGDPDTGLAGQAALIAVEAETPDLLGAPTPARSVVFQTPHGGATAYTANGGSLYARIIQWCLGYDAHLS